MTQPTTSREPDPPIDLKDPILAAFLAWLVPGLGHLYQGRVGKAVLYFVCIMGTFVFGLYLSSGKDVGVGRAVYVSWEVGDKRLYYFCQVGIGLPAMPALVQAARAKHDRATFGRFMAPPDARDSNVPEPVTLSDLHRQLGRYFELGTVYTAIAGLLNVLVIFDAFAGPFVTRAEEEEKEKKEKKAAEKESGEKNAGEKNAGEGGVKS